MLAVRTALILLAALTPLAAQPGGEWISLFDGKSLDGWKPAAFRNSGEVRVEDGSLILVPGNPLTGLNLTREFPKSNYEVRYEARRLQGNDFFASLTLPVGESFGTFVTGGWGGDIVGFSSINGWDASENETRTYFTFENGRWYLFRVQILDDRISAWIDEEPVFSFAIGGRTIGLRRGSQESTPFGFSSYLTSGAIRKVEYRVPRAKTSTRDTP